MTDELTTTASTLDRKLPSRRRSMVNSVLGGVGNWMMIGGIPYAAVSLAAEINDVKASKKLQAFALGGVVVGAVYGAFAGLHEAKELDEYRNSLNDHIDTLTQEVRGNRTKIDALTKALDARDAQAAAR